MGRKLLCALLTLTLTGCSLVPTEDRAFVLCVAVHASAGSVAVTVQIPDYKGKDEYHVLTGSGASFEAAVADVSGKAPAPLHFGQTRLAVFTRSTAESARLSDLIIRVAKLPFMRMQAQVFVTEETPQALLEALTPRTGTRLSKYLDTLLGARREQGTLLGTTLSDVLRMDGRQAAVLGLAKLEKGAAAENSGGTENAEEPGAAEAQSSSNKGEPVFSGGVLLGADERMNGLLSAKETKTLSMLTGTEQELRFQWEDCAALLHVRLCRVTLAGSVVHVSLTIRGEAEEGTPARVQTRLTEDIEELLQRLSAAQCDALGLARQAVLQGDDLTAWPERFRNLTFAVALEWLQSA